MVLANLPTGSLRSTAWLAFACLAGTQACATGPRMAPDAGPVLYPPPPDTARVQFLTSIGSERDLRGGPSFWQRLLGTAGSKAKAMAKPYGMALYHDALYVCDTPISGLVIIHLDTGSFEFFQPVGPGALSTSANCFVDARGVLYVADPGRNRVALFESGKYTGAITGSYEGKALKPGDVFVTGDRIWITDMATGQVRVFDRASHNLLFSFPKPDADTTEGLAAPANLYVAPNAVYVSDQLRGRVNVYALDGAYQRTIGAYGQGFGQFARPRGVAVDRDGIVYVVDAAFQNVQLFDRQGRLLTFIGGPSNNPGSMTLPAKVILDYDHLDRFRRYVAPGLDLKYLILVSNQYGPARINVYGFVQHRGDPAGPGR